MAPSEETSDYEALKNKGNDLFKAKKFKEAIEYYTKAIKVKEDEAILYSNRAICYLNLNKYFDAKEDCDLAIKIDPTLIKAHYRRGLAHKELFCHSKACDDFEKVLSLDTSSTQANKEIQSLQKLLEDDPRLDLKLYDKPERLRSKVSIKKFDLRNQYMGEKSYY